LFQYLAVYHLRAVRRFFGSWPRTTNRSALPSEHVVAHVWRNAFPYSLLSVPKLVRSRNPSPPDFPRKGAQIYASLIMALAGQRIMAGCKHPPGLANVYCMP
jgi:hypothetical protein